MNAAVREPVGTGPAPRLVGNRQHHAHGGAERLRADGRQDQRQREAAGRSCQRLAQGEGAVAEERHRQERGLGVGGRLVPIVIVHLPHLQPQRRVRQQARGHSQREHREELRRHARLLPLGDAEERRARRLIPVEEEQADGVDRTVRGRQIGAADLQGHDHGAVVIRRRSHIAATPSQGISRTVITRSRPTVYVTAPDTFLAGLLYRVTTLQERVAGGSQISYKNLYNLACVTASECNG